jgi:hypothetical protein
MHTRRSGSIRLYEEVAQQFPLRRKRLAVPWKVTHLCIPRA